MKGSRRSTARSGGAGKFIRHEKLRPERADDPTARRSLVKAYADQMAHFAAAA
jgi:hypothetical protein